MSKNKKLIRQLGVIALILVLYFGSQYLDGDSGDTRPSSEGPRPTAGQAQPAARSPSGTAVLADDADIIQEAYDDRRSDIWVHAAGEVVRTLADDNEGSRHQRFLVRLSNDLTVLIAHNIDLAPRIPLQRGDAVEFRGEYEWNDKGGVIHWTHHDPAGRKKGGWITHRQQKYD